MSWMFKKLPSLKHLKVFECKAFPLIVDNKRDKFEPTAQANCVMASYDECDGIYWIYNKSTRKIFRSRDVKFNEKLMAQKNEITREADEWSVSLHNMKDYETPTNDNHDKSSEENNQNEDNNYDYELNNLFDDTNQTNDTTINQSYQSNESLVSQINDLATEVLTSPQTVSETTLRRSTREKHEPSRLNIDPSKKT